MKWANIRHLSAHVPLRKRIAPPSRAARRGHSLGASSAFADAGPGHVRPASPERAARLIQKFSLVTQVVSRLTTLQLAEALTPTLQEAISSVARRQVMRSLAVAEARELGAAVILQAVSTTPFCGVVAESPFASFRQIAYIRVGQMFHTGSWLGKIVLRPAVELALVYGKLTRGVDLAQVSPQDSVARSTIPILLIHGLADDNVPAQQSEMIRSQNPEDVALWEVPRAGHCGAVNVAEKEFNLRVLGWFSSHDAAQSQRSALNR